MLERSGTSATLRTLSTIMNIDAVRAQINHFVSLLWLGIFVLWAITGITSKQTVQSRSEGPSRIAVWIVWLAWWLLFTHGFGIDILSVQFVPKTVSTSYAGAAITIAGLALSVWARIQIGRNWSGLIQVKEGHQLMHTGVYAIVRHPIYSGFMLATLGTAIAFGEISGLLAFVMILGAWGYKSRLEESVMVERFGAEYETYRRKVKSLIPFVW
jgi:protein-S-isoprenylcysteine O-methyltransferase Ste14